MIITEYVEIKINQFNYHHYNRIGYITDNLETIMVSINDISKNSPIRIKSKCDVCGKIKELSYRKYNKNISSGSYYACSNLCAKSKVESTNRDKYGVDYPLQSENKMNELKEYFTKKFGFDNPSKNDDIKLKRETTMYAKYGVKTNIILPETHKKSIEMSKSPDSIKKRKETNIDRYGFDNPMKSKEIYQRFKETNIEKYGVEFPSQNSIIFNKTQKSQFKIKEYKEIKYQGTYELDFLEFCDKNDILNKISKIKSIKYKYRNKSKYYHPDFFVEELNLIIEVKSDYYYNLHLEKNLCKQQNCIEQGYNFIFIINKDYTEFLNKIKKSSL
jgi:hypothetical protein